MYDGVKYLGDEGKLGSISLRGGVVPNPQTFKAVVVFEGHPSGAPGAPVYLKTSRSATVLVDVQSLCSAMRMPVTAPNPETSSAFRWSCARVAANAWRSSAKHTSEAAYWSPLAFWSRKSPWECRLLQGPREGCRRQQPR